MKVSNPMCVPVLILIVSVVFAAPLFAQPCVIDFDGTCPTSGPECGASFNGGDGCILAGIANCYDTGTRAYRVNENSSPLIITLDAPTVEVTVFYAYTPSIQGPIPTSSMRFYDATAGGNEVGTGLTPNGNCSQAKPGRQTINFGAETIRRIEVDVVGLGDVWVDTLTLTPDTVPVFPKSWGLLKALYR